MLRVFIEDKKLYLRGEGWQASSKITFCPNCGRPLTEPKPLTLEELKEREGKPVWVVDMDFEKGVWDIFLASTGDLSYWFMSGEVLQESEYGLLWQAFDHEPK